MSDPVLIPEPPDVVSSALRPLLKGVDQDDATRRVLESLVRSGWRLIYPDHGALVEDAAIAVRREWKPEPWQFGYARPDQIDIAHDGVVVITVFGPDRRQLADEILTVLQGRHP